ncbi:MAG: hypothetical protein J6A62_07910 [Oscillospiraceae bacterium]|nr:hypothetical protein [Oscillospiraceae bacterium]
MDKDTKLLSYIHKNAAMGTRTIPQVLSLPQSAAMSRALNSQLREYKSIAQAAQAHAKSRGETVKEPSHASQAMSAMMLRMQTLTDRSTSHLAEMMIQGSTMGTVQMTRRLNQFHANADKEIMELGKKLLETEERNIQQMKLYL